MGRDEDDGDGIEGGDADGIEGDGGVGTGIDGMELEVCCVAQPAMVTAAARVTSWM